MRLSQAAVSLLAVSCSLSEWKKLYDGGYHPRHIGIGVDAFVPLDTNYHRRFNDRPTPSTIGPAIGPPRSVGTERYSTLAPESTSFTTNDDGDGSNGGDNDSSRKGTTTLQKPSSGSLGSSIKKSLFPSRSSTSNRKSNDYNDKKNDSGNTFGPLSMSMEELALKLGGKGRAQLVWDSYRIGIDPSNLHGDVIDLGRFQQKDTFENVLSMLPTQRRSQRLSQSTVDALEGLYRDTYHNRGKQSKGSDIVQPTTKIEDGVATLSYISRSTDDTTKLLLKLVDGMEVECVIIPWQGRRSTLCISSQVGCQQGCTFCATGRMGRQRDLTSDEILAQLFFAIKLCRLEDLPSISNVVL